MYYPASPLDIFACSFSLLYTPSPAIGERGQGAAYWIGQPSYGENWKPMAATQFLGWKAERKANEGKHWVSDGEGVCVDACVARACARRCRGWFSGRPLAPLPPSTTRAEPSGERILSPLLSSVKGNGEACSVTPSLVQILLWALTWPISSSSLSTGGPSQSEGSSPAGVVLDKIIQTRDLRLAFLSPLHKITPTWFRVD